jgi:hypothetical protein
MPKIATLQKSLSGLVLLTNMTKICLPNKKFGYIAIGL